MALRKQISFLGFNINAYYNITDIHIRTVTVDGVKSYSVTVTVQTWKDDKKDINLYGRDFTFSCSIEELNFASLYGNLKKVSDFSDSIDC